MTDIHFTYFTETLVQVFLNLTNINHWKFVWVNEWIFISLLRYNGGTNLYKNIHGDRFIVWNNTYATFYPENMFLQHNFQLPHEQSRQQNPPPPSPAYCSPLLVVGLPPYRAGFCPQSPRWAGGLETAVQQNPVILKSFIIREIMNETIARLTANIYFLLFSERNRVGRVQNRSTEQRINRFAVSLQCIVLYCIFLTG